MAEYPELAATLPALRATKTNPTDLEAANKLAASIVQTRVWLDGYLSSLFDDVGKLRQTALGTNTIPASSIRGSVSNDSGAAAREILQASLGTNDFRDEAVSTAKIKLLAITTALLADGAVTAPKLGSGAVQGATANDGTQRGVALGTISTVDLRDAAVTAAKIATGGVGSAQIADNGVTTAKIVDGAVTGAKLPAGTSAQVLLHNGTTWVPTTITGALGLTSAGVATVTLVSGSVSFARITERQSAGVAGGAASAGNNTRGNATAWTIDEQTVAGTVTLLASGKIGFNVNGVYLIFASAPGYSVGSHKINLRVKANPTGSYVENYGSSEIAPLGAQTRSQITLLIAVTGASIGTPAEIELQHWFELTKATNGQGVPTGTDLERYAMIEILQISNA